MVMFAGLSNNMFVILYLSCFIIIAIPNKKGIDTKFDYDMFSLFESAVATKSRINSVDTNMHLSWF